MAVAALLLEDPTLPHRRIAPLLALAVAITPLALDAYLPAFPLIAEEVGVQTSEVGLTLSIYVFVMAFGQLVGGPLSDRFGRRPILYFGLVIFILGSLLTNTSETLNQMLLWRALQAFGGGWVAVSVPAIVRDRTSGIETARLFSLIALIMFIAPALAPTVGSLLLSVTDWRGIFDFLSIYALTVGILLYLFLFRGAGPAKRGPRQPLHTLVTNYRHVFANRTAMLLIFLQASAFSVMLIYLTHAPFLIQDWLGLGSNGFSLVFALNVSAMAGVSLLNRILLNHFQPEQILSVAVRMQCVGVIVLLAITLLPVPRWLLIPAMMWIVGTMGATAPNVQAGVLQQFRALSGTAAALLGAIQFAGGGIMSGISAVLAEGRAENVGLSMLACSVLAVVLMYPAVRRLRLTQPEAATAP